MFVLNNVMNDDTKYFKWHTAQLMSLKLKYMFLLVQSVICSLLALWCATATHYFQLGLYRTWVFQYSAKYEYE